MGESFSGGWGGSSRFPSLIDDQPIKELRKQLIVDDFEVFIVILFQPGTDFGTSDGLATLCEKVNHTVIV